MRRRLVHPRFHAPLTPLPDLPGYRHASMFPTNQYVGLSCLEFRVQTGRRSTGVLELVLMSRVNCGLAAAKNRFGLNKAIHLYKIS
jgi:hypothetical protein